MEIKIIIKGQVDNKGKQIVYSYPGPKEESYWSKSVKDPTDIRDYFTTDIVYSLWKNEYGNYYGVIVKSKTNKDSKYNDSRDGRLFIVVFTGKKIFKSGKFAKDLLDKIKHKLYDLEDQDNEGITNLLSNVDNKLIEDYCSVKIPQAISSLDSVYRTYKSENELTEILEFPNQKEYNNKILYIVPNTAISVHIPQNFQEIKSPVKKTFFISDPLPSGVSVDKKNITEGDSITITYKKAGGYYPESIRLNINSLSNKYFEYIGTQIKINDTNKAGIKFKRCIRIKCINGKKDSIHFFSVRFNNRLISPNNNNLYIFDNSEKYLIKIKAKGYYEETINIKPEDFSKGEICVPLKAQDRAINIYFKDPHGHYIKDQVNIKTDSKLYSYLQYPAYEMIEYHHVDNESENSIWHKIKWGLLAFGIVYFLYAIYSFIFNKSLPIPFNLFEKTEIIVDPPIYTTSNDSTEFEGNDISLEEENEKNDHDIQYLKKEDVWNIDSIQSNNYKALFNTFKKGDIDNILNKEWFPDDKEKVNGYWTKILGMIKTIWKDKDKNKKQSAVKKLNILTKNKNSIDLEEIASSLGKLINNLPCEQEQRENNTNSFNTKKDK